jgi:hypothetical protein
MWWQSDAGTHADVTASEIFMNPAASNLLPLLLLALPR